MAATEPQENSVGRCLHALLAGKFPARANISALLASGRMNKLFLGLLFRGRLLKKCLCGEQSAALAFRRTPVAKP